MALLLVGCGGADSASPAAPERPNVLLITVDTLRPDALGWVAGENETPALDALAAEGFRFPSAVSPVPLTLPAHLSMFTGMVPRRHGVRDNGQVLGAAPATLAERLRDAGWSTGAFISGYPLQAQFGADRGFDHYDDTLPVGAEGWLERPASATSAAALEWLRATPEPWFLWVHYYDPHDPYEPPEELVRPGRKGLYHGEVAVTDRGVGELLAGLPDTPRLTVFAADHGESLGQHGEPTHGFFLYDSSMRIPMVFHFPGRISSSESSAAPRLVDLAPTVLDLTGLPPLEGTDGVSLVPTLEGAEQEIPPAYLETRQPWITYGWSPLEAVRTERWKLVLAPRPELYDLMADPQEATNRIADERPVVRRLQAVARERKERPVVGSSTTADAEALAQLRALGYLGSGGSDREPPPGLPDPKDRIQARNLLTEGELALRRQDFRSALASFEAVLEEDPGNRFATLRSGIAHLKAGAVERALTLLEESVRLDPEQAEARFALADALTRAGRLERAEQEWLETVRLQPRRVAAWANLGTTLGRRGELDRAIEAFTRAAELDPGNGLLWSNLAAAEQSAGRLDDALEHLLKASENWTGPFPQRAGLGALLFDTGRRAEARRWLAAARPEEAGFVQARLRLVALELQAGDLAAAEQALADAETQAPGLRQQLRGDERFAALFEL